MIFTAAHTMDDSRCSASGPRVSFALVDTVLAPDVTDVRHDLKVVGSLTLVSRRCMTEP